MAEALKASRRIEKIAGISATATKHFVEQYGPIGISQVRAQFMRSSALAQRRAIRLARLIIRQEKYCKHAQNRIAASKVLVAALPTTLRDIGHLLKNRSSRIAYEVHFTLFCYLDRDELPRSSSLRRKILALLKNYLMQASSQRAHASWMCGDLLGDHWGTPEAVDVLCYVAENSKEAVARDSAVHGLAHALDRLSPSQDKRVRELLEALAIGDPSEGVRRSCRNTLAGSGK